MTDISNEYLKEVEDLLRLQREKADEYYAAKNVTKQHSQSLKDYMIKNRIRDIGEIELKSYKGHAYLRLKDDVFDNIKE